MSDCLEPLDPTQGVEMYHEAMRDEHADSTRKSEKH